MIGTLIFMLVCLWAFCLGAGMLLAYMTWTPPVSKGSK